MNSSGSWSDSVKSLQTRQTFRFRTIETAELMDEYLNFEFCPAFQHRSNHILGLIAFDYLNNGLMEEFNQYLDQIAARPGEKSRYYRVILLMRRFPRTLTFMRWCLNLVREAKRRLIHVFERC